MNCDENTIRQGGQEGVSSCGSNNTMSTDQMVLSMVAWGSGKGGKLGLGGSERYYL